MPGWRPCPSAPWHDPHHLTQFSLRKNRKSFYG
nr:MAG TPA: hypothetical protein [Caudoviricetes sp.]DAY83882.1 MAG TPA: hypothetical protein [Caudoviricetes sp.]DAY94784.1 MAG TPA: hypothetical protein [Caudoviricetes sp.]